MLGQHVIHAYISALDRYYKEIQFPFCREQGKDTYSYVERELARLPYTRAFAPGTPSLETGKKAKSRKGRRANAYSEPLPDRSMEEKPRRKAHSAPVPDQHEPDQQKSRKEKKASTHASRHTQHKSTRRKKKAEFSEEEIKDAAGAAASNDIHDDEADMLADQELRDLLSLPPHSSVTSPSSPSASGSASASTAHAISGRSSQVAPPGLLKTIEYDPRESPPITSKMRKEEMCGILLDHQLGNVSMLAKDLSKKPGVILDLSENLLVPRAFNDFYHITLCNPKDKQPWFQCSEVQKILESIKVPESTTYDIYHESLSYIHNTVTIGAPATYYRYLVLELEPTTLTFHDEPVSDNLHLSVAKINEREAGEITHSAPAAFIKLFTEELRGMSGHKLDVSSTQLSCHG